MPNSAAASRASAVRNTRSRLTPMTIIRVPGVGERIFVHLETVNAWWTAAEIVEGSGIKIKTVQNLLAPLLKEIPRPIAEPGNRDQERSPQVQQALTPLRGA